MKTMLLFQRAFQLLGLAVLSVILSAGLSANEPTKTDKTTIASTVTSEGEHMVIEAKGVPPPPPLFFSAGVEQEVHLGEVETTGEARLKIHVLQGRTDVFTVGLSGDGEILSVAGAGLRDWAVRQTTDAGGGKRLLDIRPVEDDVENLELVVRSRLKKTVLPGTITVLQITPGEAVGFSSKVTLKPDSNLDVRVTAISGMVALDGDSGLRAPRQFFATGNGRLEVRLAQRGAASTPAELSGVQVSGKLADAGGHSMDFRLRGQLRVQEAGAHLRLLQGQAALVEKASGDGWHLELVQNGLDGFAYDLVGDRVGTVPFEVGFVARVIEQGDWRTLDFAIPAGAIVPLILEGLGADCNYNPDTGMIPVATTQGWQTYLPASGKVTVAWKKTRAESEGTLFFNSAEQTDIRVCAGVLRETARIKLQVLQGRLNQARFKLEGAGEILGVEGTNVQGWKVMPSGEARVLEVQFSRPVENEGQLTISTQTTLEGFPVQVDPLRLNPEGVVRHSGFLRVSNSGAVRLEMTDVSGLMQLAPTQFPGPAADANARQVFVYRFPSAGYGYHVSASQIQPEVALSAISIYELTDTDRVIRASLELDVREAPLRDWTLLIPQAYTVATVTGNNVADYVAESAAVDGYRTLKILFNQPVDGRQLLDLRLENNQPATAGDWVLTPLKFPGAKSMRGHVGVVSTPGFRIVPAKMSQLVEVPLSYFPQQTAGLQQAWRLRDPEWTAQVKIEALGQSVQADAFHLYSVKEGVVYGSVLLNYFVVGSPANEWRVEVPQSLGNVDIVGQNVRRDWRREGDQIIVSLHQPVLGAATLLVTFEQPISARGGTIQPGQIRPLGVQSERGYIAVVSPLQVKHSVSSAEGGLLKLEPLELPAELRLLATSPALAVYQYTARPFKLEMNLEWYAPGETVDQVLDYAKLTSQVSRDGQVVTDARYFVKTRGQKALRFNLPEGAKLWEARVDGEMTNARVDGGQTLIALPARMNPNEPVAVTLRLGQAMGSSSHLRLVAPRIDAPTVVSEWTLHSDSGYLLVPRGGNAEVVHPALTETGFEWVSNHGRMAVAVVLCLAAFAAILVRNAYGWPVGAGLLMALLSVCASLMSASHALSLRRPNLQQLTYAASMVPAGDDVVINVDNLRAGPAMVETWGVCAALAGLVTILAGVVLVAKARAKSAILLPAGLVLLAVGLLAQRGGATLFFGAAAAAVFVFLIVPVFLRWNRDRREAETIPPADPGAGTTTIVPALIIVGLVGLGFMGGAPAARGDGTPKQAPVVHENGYAVQSMVQTWTIRENRLLAEVDLVVRGAPGDSFLLLKSPAILTEFKGDGLHLGKGDWEGQPAYYVAPDHEGILTAHLRYELSVPKLSQGIELPTGPCAAQKISVVLDQGGWEVNSSAAVQVQPASALGEGRSGATLVLVPQKKTLIKLQPRGRDVGSEETQFFSETSNLYLPGPGVVNGFTRVTVRPVQGRVGEMDLEIPTGLTVGEVGHGAVGSWRFDPSKRKLHVTVEPAQSTAFSFVIETQLGAGALPFDLSLTPIKVLGASNEVGSLALAFGGDAQPEGVHARNLSSLNIQDFDTTLLPQGKDGRPIATLQQAWRFSQAGGQVELKVAPVAPEVRVSSRQVLTLDDDRMIMAVDLDVAITRVGLFKLSFALPEGLEVEALSGPALSQWTEAQEGGRRIVTLHLNGRTLGDQSFALTLAGAAPHAQAAWPVPHFLVREATRQTGELVLVPGKGLRLRAVDRARVTQVDPRIEGAVQPGTLAFHLLQEDWTLSLGIEALEPWVTVQALEELTVREGQTLTRLGLRCRVENAAVKQFRVRLPGLSEEHSRTVRATGSVISDIVRVAGTPDLWEIRFQHGILGETDLQIEYQGPAGSTQKDESLLPPEFPGARQTVQFFAVRSSGRLELAAGNPPRGWNRTDWNAVPACLQDRAEHGVPALCYRVAEPEGPLAIAIRRHEIAGALKLRVTQGEFTTLFSAGGSFLTAADLKVDVLEKSTLRVRLPEGSRLFNTIVNGESVAAVREGDAYLFHVSPGTEANSPATVHLVYAATRVDASGSIGLAAPSLSVPLENVTWHVVIPTGYSLESYKGSLRLEEEKAAGWYGVDQYQSLVASKRSAETRKAVALLEEATDLLQKGDQQKAGEMLSRVSNGQALDEASNEDARVQLRNLKTQQTVLGLNTRRQRLYLDNRIEGARNEQLEQAANLNPFMQGKVNFDPKQMDQLLMGNTAEENVSLKGIAARLVDQQLTAEPAPGAIDISVPERGRVLTFARSLQVDGGAPLVLQLEVAKVSQAQTGFILFLLVDIAVIASLPFWPKGKKEQS